jgi:phage baseplate assembly protein W
MGEDADFIGRGWAHPVRVNARGGIALLEGDAELEAAIRLVLQTMPGERVMRPSFGCSVWEHSFDAAEPNVLGSIERRVRDALGQWEPRIDVEHVSVRAHPEQPGRVDIELSYVARATNDLRNLVHPFYVIPQEGE